MARRRGEDEDRWADDPVDEGPDPADVDDAEATETVECPACGEEIYEGAEQCPECGEYLSADTAPRRRRVPWWVWLGVILALLGTLPWIY